MYQSKSFFKLSKGGRNVAKAVREHYLRDDIWSGSPCDPECPADEHKLSAAATHYLLIDTNVALHQLDFLEHAAITDVIVCSVVLDEVKHKNQAAYQRLRALTASPDKRFFVFANENNRETYVKTEAGESPNDRNDRALRVAAAWYAARINQVPTILLTNDADNRSKALREGLQSLGVMAYCRTHHAELQELQDVVAASAQDDEDDNAGTAAGGPSSSAGGSARGTKRRRLFAEHKAHGDMMAGIKEGKYHQGALRVSRFNPFEGWVGSESVGEDILISGRVDMNRAFDGDVVCVELLPEDEWRGASSKLPSGPKGAAANDAAGEGEEEEEDEQAVEEGVQVFQVAPGEHYEGADSGSVKRPTGRVVGIIKRNWRSRGYCGSLKPPDAGRGGRGGRAASMLFMPVERRFPMIRIQTRQADTLMDQRLVVAVDGWEADSAYPHGHYVRTLGRIGDKDTETEVILIEHDINTQPFTPAVHACVPLLPWSVTQQDAEDPNRLDMRHLCICSVDPPGCKDIDDALHARLLENGNYEVGVHIADVTHFLRPHTAMDLEASARATTTYLVQRRIDMLPKPLTEDICSLRGGVERLTFSVLWEMTPDAHILSSRFTKGLIRSRAALTYADAQACIDDASRNDDVAQGLRALMSLSKHLRARRYEAGALQLASPEVKFQFDSERTTDPMDVGMYQTRDTNHMVEEMMLLANQAVAQKILRHFPSCSLLRRHQTPAPRQFEPIVAAAASAGIAIDVSSSKALSASLDAAVRADDPYFNKLVRIMTTRCMTQAQYFGSGDVAPSDYNHYGLASALYTHFTSPIRRYADVVVHRLLAASIDLEPLPDSARDKEALSACSDNLNKRHHNAQQAGRASVELFTLIFFHGKNNKPADGEQLEQQLMQGVLADARVTKVKANGLVVFVPKYGIEGPVYLSAPTPTAEDQAAAGSSSTQAAAGGSGAIPKQGNKPQGRSGQKDKNNTAPGFVLDEEKQMVTSLDGSITYRVFDKVAVCISVEVGIGHRRSLLMRLVPRDTLPVSELV